MKYSTRKKKSNRVKKFLIMLPLGIVTGLIISFIVMDNFNTYAYMLFLQGRNRGDLGDPADYVQNLFQGQGGSNNSSYGSSYSSDYGVNSTGYSGIPMILANKLQNGYAKDWLDIANSIVNDSKLNPKSTKLKDASGNLLTPNIFAMIGISMAETTWNQNTWLPPSSIDWNAYPYGSVVDEVKFDAYNVDSEFVASHPNVVASGYSAGDLKHGNYYTEFQFQSTWASVYPNGSNGDCHVWPTLYKSSSMGDRERTKADTDAAFLPDRMAAAFESAWGRIPKAASAASMSVDALGYCPYAFHNMGEGGVACVWASGAGTRVVSGAKFGFKDQSGVPVWSNKNTVTSKEMASCAFNEIGPLISKVQDYIYAKVDNGSDLDFSINEQDQYEGLVTTLMLSSKFGFIATQSAKDKMLNRAKASGWKKGALIGYRVGTGRDDATQEEMMSYILNVEIQPIDTGFYGEAYTGNPGKSYGEYCIHHYCENHKVYNAQGAGPQTALHVYALEGTRGVFLTAVGAPYAYWKMLTLNGVECTCDEARKDGAGLLIPNITVQQVTGQSGTTNSINWDNPVTGSYWSDYVIGDFNPYIETVSNSPFYNRKLSISNGTHGGEDWVCKKGGGCDIYAVGDGVVSSKRTTSESGGYGNCIIYDLKKSSDDEPLIQILCAHLAKFGDGISVGSPVRREETVLGFMGNTGISGGVHLHTEVRITWNGKTYRTSYGQVSTAKKGWYPIKWAPAALFKSKKAACKVYGWSEEGYKPLAISGLTGDDAKYNGIMAVRGDNDIKGLPHINYSNSGGVWERTGLNLWHLAAQDNMLAAGGKLRE